MSVRSSRLRTGARVMADANHWPELLDEMSIVDGDGDPLQGVSMEGTIKAKTDAHFNVFLDCPGKCYRFPISKVRPLRGNLPSTDYFVVVNATIVTIKGLHLPNDVSLDGYHTDRKDAESELQESVAKLPDKTPVVADATAAVTTVEPQRKHPNAVTE